MPVITVMESTPSTGASYVDVLRAWGSDYQLTATGDLAVLQDTVQDPIATKQRIIRLIQMIPIAKDDFGNILSTPDDMFNPTYGSGIRTLLGQLPIQSLVHGIQTRILAALALDPFIVSAPSPIVDVALNPTAGFLTITLTCTAITGQPITIPPQQFPIL